MHSTRSGKVYAKNEENRLLKTGSISGYKHFDRAKGRFIHLRLEVVCVAEKFLMLIKFLAVTFNSGLFL